MKSLFLARLRRCGQFCVFDTKIPNDLHFLEDKTFLKIKPAEISDPTTRIYPIFKQVSLVGCLFHQFLSKAEVMNTQMTKSRMVKHTQTLRLYWHKLPDQEAMRSLLYGYCILNLNEICTAVSEERLEKNDNNDKSMTIAFWPIGMSMADHFTLCVWILSSYNC